MADEPKSESPIERSIRSAKICHVHWHVTKQIYSVKETGHPVYYVRELSMKDVVFHVDTRLRAMFVERTSRRTVHALIKGRIVASSARAADGALIRCNPFEFEGFRTTDGLQVVRASALSLYADRRMIATLG